jgi:hypothetical protein
VWKSEKQSADADAILDTSLTSQAYISSPLASSVMMTKFSHHGQCVRLYSRIAVLITG